jgi:CVNH domain
MGAFCRRVNRATLCTNFRIDWRYLLTRRLIIVAGALLTMLAVVPPASAQMPRGSYVQTCRDVRFDGATLSAVCLTAGGQSVATRLAVGACRGDISNLNGQLSCPGGGGQPYGGRPPQYGGPPPQYDGGPPRSPYGYPPPRPGYGETAPPYGGGRDYGGGREYGGRLPGGSWRASCGNAVMQGPILFADCQRIDGRVVQARGDLRACARFGNANGRLTCE